MFSLGRIRLSSKTRFSVQLTEPSWSDVSVARFVAASKPTPLVSQFLLEFTDDTALGLNDDVSSLDLIIVGLRVIVNVVTSYRGETEVRLRTKD